MGGLGLLQFQYEPQCPVVLPPTLTDRQRKVGIDQIQVDSRLPRLLQQCIFQLHASYEAVFPRRAKRISPPSGPVTQIRLIAPLARNRVRPPTSPLQPIPAHPPHETPRGSGRKTLTAASANLWDASAAPAGLKPGSSRRHSRESRRDPVGQPLARQARTRGVAVSPVRPANERREPAVAKMSCRRLPRLIT